MSIDTDYTPSIDNPCPIDQEAWEWETLLNYFVDIYENPAQAHGMRQQEFLDFISEWSQTQEAEQYQDWFTETVKQMQEDFVSHETTDGSTNVNVVYNPDCMNQCFYALEEDFEGDYL